MAKLTELSEIGMQLARGVLQGAAELTAAGGDPGLAYSRISRAVRLSVALEARMDQDAETLARELAGQLAAEAKAAAERAAWIQERPKIERFDAVLERIEAETPEWEYEAREDDIIERLKDYREEDDFLDGPVEDLVAAIRRDLGLPVLAEARDDGAEDDGSDEQGPSPEGPRGFGQAWAGPGEERARLPDRWWASPQFPPELE